MLSVKVLSHPREIQEKVSKTASGCKFRMNKVPRVFVVYIASENRESFKSFKSLADAKFTASQDKNEPLNVKKHVYVKM